MSKKDNVVIVYGGDWEGIYINGELKYEGHSLQTSELLDVLGVKHDLKEIDEDIFYDNDDRLPTLLKNCRFEVE